MPVPAGREETEEEETGITMKDWLPPFGLSHATPRPTHPPPRSRPLTRNEKNFGVSGGSGTKVTIGTKDAVRKIQNSTHFSLPIRQRHQDKDDNPFRSSSNYTHITAYSEKVQKSHPAIPNCQVRSKSLNYFAQFFPFQAHFVFQKCLRARCLGKYP